MSVSTPPLISVPFADSGAKNLIPIASASPLASYTDGFPAVTMTDPDAGGVPPSGEDFNGIFNIITQHLLYINSGGKYRFNADQATAIGGYPLGFVVQSNDGGSEYVSLIGANTYDPNTPTNVGPYWAPYAGAASMDGHYLIDTGGANAYSVAQFPPRAVNTNGNEVVFKAKVNNTGASTLSTGGATVALRRTDDTAVQAGDILAGSIYSAVYDGATGHYVLTTPVTSQFSPAVLQTSASPTINLQLAANGSNTHVTITANILSVYNGSDGYVQLNMVNELLDAEDFGVGGLDTGVLDVSTWYYVYIIYDPVSKSTSSLCSLSATAPTLPGDYSFYKRVGSFCTDATANKYPLAFIQRGNKTSYAVTTGSNVTGTRIMASTTGAVGSTTVPTWVAIPVAAFVPSTATAIKIAAHRDSSSGHTLVAPNNSYGSRDSTTNTPPIKLESSSTGMSLIDTFLLESSDIYWATEAVGTVASMTISQVRCLGWEDSV